MLNKVIYKIGLFFRNNLINHKLEFLLKSQFWSRKQLETYQLEQVKDLLAHAYDKSAYYQELFNSAQFLPKDFKSLTDINQIPTTSKSALLQNKNRIQVYIENQKHYYSETSGSTGEPLVFYRHQVWDAWHNASVFRGYSWYDVNPWEKNGYLWGYNFSFKKAIIVKLLDLLQNRFRMFTYEEDEIRRFCNKLKSARYLNGYSSMIYEVAKYVEKDETLKNEIDLALIKGTSEKIYESYQIAAKNAFGKRVISEYGAAEAGIIAFECPEGKMHVNMETVIVEEIEGEILVTNLTSHSFPIIRYELGDYIVIDTETICSCGNESYLIKEVTGRVGSNIYGKENKYPSLTLYYIFKNIAINYSIILNYQVVQKVKGSILILMETNLSELEKSYLDSEIRKYFGNDIEYKILEDQSLLTKTGKKKDFISEIEI